MRAVLTAVNTCAVLTAVNMHAVLTAILDTKQLYIVLCCLFCYPVHSARARARDPFEAILPTYC